MKREKKSKKGGRENESFVLLSQAAREGGIEG